MKLKLCAFISLFLVSAVTVFISCQGPAGPQGDTGPVGPAGESTFIHAGEGAPDQAVGEPGDFYLNLSTGELYGPKDASNGWGNPVKLAGSDGDDGSRIFSGEGPPDKNLGNEGDYYLDKESYDLYGPKTDSWGTPVTLQGPPGDDGNANIIYSDWLDISWNIVDNPGIKMMSIEEPLLTEDFIDGGGVIIMYIKIDLEDGYVIYQIPHISGNDHLFFGFVNISGSRVELEFGVEAIDSSKPVADYQHDQVRYILIPAGMPAKISPEFLDDFVAYQHFSGL